MCGIIGIIGHEPVNQAIYDGLTVLQHRGQDAAGIVTSDGRKLYLRRDNGLVKDVFNERHMAMLQGNMGIGHVRYPTAGSSSSAEAQPFYVNSPYGISLAHNGNLTNAHVLKKELYRQDRRQINTESDSEILLNVFAQELLSQDALHVTPGDIFAAVEGVHRRCKGAYAVVAMLTRDGLVGFRDPNGIRPLVYGVRETPHGKEFMLASESVALDVQGYRLVRDIEPGKLFSFAPTVRYSPASVRRTPAITPAFLNTCILPAPIPSLTMCLCTKRGCAWGAKWRNTSCVNGRIMTLMW